MSAVKYYPIYPDGKVKAFTVSYDDGNDCDERLVTALRSHHAKGTFNINSGMFGDLDDAPAPRRWRRMTAEECVQLYGDDMEIAVHGAIHPFWDWMASVNVMRDILDDKRELERLTGKRIRGAAAPYGRMSDDAVQILRLADFAYCRVTACAKKLNLRDYDPLRFAGTVRHRDPDAVALAREFAESNVRGGERLLYYLWGHSYEFVQENNWEVLDEILAIVCDRGDVWYCTNLELFEYIAAAKKLQWNVDATAAYNPTATDVWLRRTIQHKDPVIDAVRIPAGQTVTL